VRSEGVEGKKGFSPILEVLRIGEKNHQREAGDLDLTRGHCTGFIVFLDSLKNKRKEKRKREGERKGVEGKGAIVSEDRDGRKGLFHRSRQCLCSSNVFIKKIISELSL